MLYFIQNHITITITIIICFLLQTRGSQTCNHQTTKTTNSKNIIAYTIQSFKCKKRLKIQSDNKSQTASAIAKLEVKPGLSIPNK